MLFYDKKKQYLLLKISKHYDLLLSVEVLIENLEDDPVFIAEYRTKRTKIPILTKFSDPK